MPQYYPVVIPAGRSLAGDSLGFHAYSLRLDNCTNQWMLEETSMAYIPPYSLGMCLRLYGTGVAILLNQAPVGQPQLAPITGEQVVGVYSDQLRTEVAASPIRQFTLVQSVSDLTQGAMPATPPVGITRMWAAADGTIHYLLPSGVDATLISTTNLAANVATQPLGGDLAGTVSNGLVEIRNNSSIFAWGPGPTLRNVITFGTEELFWDSMGGGFRWVNQGNTAEWMRLESPSGGTLTVAGVIATTGGAINSGASVDAGNGIYYFSNNLGVYWQWDGTHITTPNPIQSSSYITATTSLSANGGYIYFASSNAPYLYWNGSNFIFNGGSLFVGGSSVFLNTGTNSNVYLQSDGTNLLCFANAGSLFTRVSAIYVQNQAAGYTVIYASAFSVQSSQRFKEAIEPLDPAECLAQVMDARSDPVIFTVTDSQRRDIGFIAEDLARVVPQVVDYDDEGQTLGVHYGALTATLWGALRALENRVTTLEAA